MGSIGLRGAALVAAHRARVECAAIMHARMAILTAVVLGVALPVLASWRPLSWKDESTIELRTNCSDEGEHWSTVWLVVLDDQVYVRLGKRAADRISCNATRPWLAARIDGQQFDHVLAVEAPDRAERVAEAMKEKYWLDVLVRYFDHPMTLRLSAE